LLSLDLFDLSVKKTDKPDRKEKEEHEKENDSKYADDLKEQTQEKEHYKRYAAENYTGNNKYPAFNKIF
jgi:hypothetical protein